MADEARFCAGCGTAVEDNHESTPLQAERYVYTPPGASRPYGGGADAAQTGLTRDERNMAMFVHASTFSGVVIPFGNLIGPLIIWLMRRDESQFVDRHGRAALNFQISMTIYMIISLILVMVFVGILMLIGFFILDVVMTIVALVRASEGREFKYPLAIPFFKQSS